MGNDESFLDVKGIPIGNKTEETMQKLTKGTILENTYEIIEEIGSGGGGIVFKARHLRLQTDVVVKKIKDEVRGKVNFEEFETSISAKSL